MICLKCETKLSIIEELNMFLCGYCRVFWKKSILEHFKNYDDYLKASPKYILNIEKGNL